MHCSRRSHSCLGEGAGWLCPSEDPARSGGTTRSGAGWPLGRGGSAKPVVGPPEELSPFVPRLVLFKVELQQVRSKSEVLESTNAAVGRRNL